MADPVVRVVDTILTDMHQPGDGRFELLKAFVDKAALHRTVAGALDHDYCGPDFGDFMPIERQTKNAMNSKRCRPSLLAALTRLSSKITR